MVVTEVGDEALIEAAASVLRPHIVDDRLFGDVGATLITADGNLYSGVCIDTGSGTGFCAEHAAVAAMVTAGEYRIDKIVAVWRAEDGELYVVPPCGRCREFIRQVDPANLDAEVILGLGDSAKLRDLLPLHEWPGPPGSQLPLAVIAAVVANPRPPEGIPPADSGKPRSPFRCAVG